MLSEAQLEDVAAASRAELARLDAEAEAKRLAVAGRVRRTDAGPGLDPEAPESRAVVTRACDIAPRPVGWVWDGRIPAGMVSLLAGREGTGKSTMITDRTARSTRGDLEGAHYGRPRSVVIAAAEDSWAHTIVPRLLAAGADLTRVLRVQIRLADLGTCELSLPDDVHVLGEVIRAHDVAMVVLDPLISRLSRRLDTHRDAEVRQGLEPLARLADETGVAVVGLIHVNKTATRDPGTSIMGSRGFVAVARAVMYVALDAEDPRRRVLSVVKSNVGPDDTAGLPSLTYAVEGATVETAEGPATTSRVAWTGVAARGVREILAAGQDHGGGDSARATAEGWLRELLAEGAVLSEEVRTQAQEAGLSWATVRRAQESLGIRPRKAGGRFGGDPSWFWALPSAPEDAHPPLKMLTHEDEHLQAKVSIFRGEALPSPPEPDPADCPRCGSDTCPGDCPRRPVEVIP